LLARALLDDDEAATAAAAEAVRVRREMSFAHLFAPGSQGEVPIRGRIHWRGDEIELLARIDRVVVEPDRVLIVEFKTDRRVPAIGAKVSTGYVTQLALYARAARSIFPNRPIEAAILWTAEPRLDTIPSSFLEAAEAELDPLPGPS
jgi:ATP-dependent helicase/nuclease subunit A